MSIPQNLCHLFFHIWEDTHDLISVIQKRECTDLIVGKCDDYCQIKSGKRVDKIVQDREQTVSRAHDHYLQSSLVFDLILVRHYPDWYYLV